MIKVAKKIIYGNRILIIFISIVLFFSLCYLVWVISALPYILENTCIETGDFGLNNPNYCLNLLGTQIKLSDKLSN